MNPYDDGQVSETSHRPGHALARTFPVMAFLLVGCSSIDSSYLETPAETWNKKIVASKTKKFPQEVIESKTRSGWPETVVCLIKRGCEEKLRRMLDKAGLNYNTDPNWSNGDVLHIEVPSFTEETWIKRLRASGLVYAARRLPVGAGVGGTRIGLELKTVFPSEPPPDRAQELAFCNRFLQEFAHGLKDVEFTVSPTKRGSCYRITITGPSTELALARRGRWELHEFEFMFAGYGPGDCELEINHLDSYTVRSPANERPPNSRFFADKSNQIARDQYVDLEKFVGRMTEVLFREFEGQHIDG